MNVEVLRDLIKKCDIYFEDQLISGELLLRVFTDFLSEEADRQENKGSIILHTASPCFDAIAVAWSALAVIAGNGADHPNASAGRKGTLRKGTWRVYRH